MNGIATWGLDSGLTGSGRTHAWDLVVRALSLQRVFHGTASERLVVGASWLPLDSVFCLVEYFASTSYIESNLSGLSELPMCGLVSHVYRFMLHIQSRGSLIMQRCCVHASDRSTGRKGKHWIVGHRFEGIFLNFGACCMLEPPTSCLSYKPLPSTPAVLKVIETMLQNSNQQINAFFSNHPRAPIPSDWRTALVQGIWRH
jgi:hypothetical protein